MADKPTTTPITIEGTAHDAKAGAVLVTDRGAIYIQKLESWPADIRGRRVRARGFILQKKMIPAPVNERGELVQGAVGDQLVLCDATWAAI
jgi:hypothetical protein